ncbi:MAG: exodeoxyribonuclease VII small subunit [Lachnospiraceae bacterium]|nr:exodeoxyribonuclease VII small subunit [Lachnospiraceae bacterium]
MGTKKSESKEKDMSFEQQFERLDELVEKMEDEDTTLEESFESYKEGMMLVKSLNSMIDKIEKEVMELAEEEEEPEDEP